MDPFQLPTTPKKYRRQRRAGAQLKLCLGRWEGAQSVTPPLMVVPLPLMKPERRGGGSNPLHPGSASASADVAGHKRMAKGFLRHSECGVRERWGDRREDGLPARHLLRQPHNTKRRMRCNAREGSGRVRGRACAALSIIIVIFGCIHRIVYAHSALCTVAASLSNRTARPLASLMEFAESTALSLSLTLLEKIP